jgi:hypothetical protein
MSTWCPAPRKLRYFRGAKGDTYIRADPKREKTRGISSASLSTPRAFCIWRLAIVVAVIGWPSRVLHGGRSGDWGRRGRHDRLAFHAFAIHVLALHDLAATMIATRASAAVKMGAALGEILVLAAATSAAARPAPGADREEPPDRPQGMEAEVPLAAIIALAASAASAAGAGGAGAARVASAVIGIDALAVGAARRPAVTFAGAAGVATAASVLQISATARRRQQNSKAQGNKPLHLAHCYVLLLSPSARRVLMSTSRYRQKNRKNRANPHNRQFQNKYRAFPGSTQNLNSSHEGVSGVPALAGRNGLNRIAYDLVGKNFRIWVAWVACLRPGLKVGHPGHDKKAGKPYNSSLARLMSGSV